MVLMIKLLSFSLQLPMNILCMYSLVAGEELILNLLTYTGIFSNSLRASKTLSLYNPCRWLSNSCH